jgi:hypothetical protein
MGLSGGTSDPGALKSRICTEIIGAHGIRSAHQDHIFLSCNAPPVKSTMSGLTWL